MSKKKEIGRHLRFYMYSCLEKKLPSFGLCSCSRNEYIDESLLSLFKPSFSNEDDLERIQHDSIYWGSDDFDCRVFEFTPLRQTIGLFMAAINNEL